MVAAAKNVYADFEVNIFFESCRYIAANSPFLYLEYFVAAYESAERARRQFTSIFAIEPRRIGELNEEVSTSLSLIKIWIVSPDGVNIRK